MRLLHTIRPAERTAWVWAYVTGRNGHPIGQEQGIGVRLHAYVITRGHPTVPPVQTDRPLNYRDPNYSEYLARSYWHPWAPTMTRAMMLTPVCGQIRTRSSQPYLSYASSRFARDETRCPRCVEAAAQAGATVTAQQELVAVDPWSSWTHFRRATEIDPGSGQ